MSGPESMSEATELLYREALCLDEQRWDNWLDLMTEDVEYWVPAWKTEHEPTDNPASEISLIYLTARVRLEERVTRIRSGRSAASLVLPRTAHAISNVLVEDGARADELLVNCVCVTHIYDPKRRRENQSNCRYTVRLVRENNIWKIAAKKIILLNDNLPTKLEFYML